MGHDSIDLLAIQNQLADYFVHLGNRVEKLTRTLGPEQLWVNPLPFGNSVGNVVVHLTGSLSHFIGAGVAESGYVRNRAAEFSDAPFGRTADEILAAFNATVGMVVQTLRSQDGEALGAPFATGGSPVQNRFGIFLVCAGHMSNHIGQMVYLLHAHGYQFDEKSW
jgi:hypothetical protein